MGKHDKKIEQLTEEIQASHLDSRHKTYAIDVLGNVEKITNGCPDKIQGITDVLLDMTAYMMRRDVFLQETHEKQVVAFQTMVKSHAEKCPLVEQIPELVLDVLKSPQGQEAVSWDGVTERRGRDAPGTVTIQGRGMSLSGSQAAVIIVSLSAVAITAIIKFA